mgnify:CR=1 FL=1
MFGLSFKTGLKNRVLWTLLILIVAIFLGLFLAVRLFISKAPSTKLLVNNTWCSMPGWSTTWQFDEDDSFSQQTTFFDQYSRWKVFESGSWHLDTVQNGDVKIKITWHESQKREGEEQYFTVTTNGTNLLIVSGDLYGFGEENNMIFYSCER